MAELNTGLVFSNTPSMASSFESNLRNQEQLGLKRDQLGLQQKQLEQQQSQFKQKAEAEKLAKKLNFLQEYSKLQTPEEAAKTWNEPGGILDMIGVDGEIGPLAIKQFLPELEAFQKAVKKTGMDGDKQTEMIQQLVNKYGSVPGLETQIDDLKTQKEDITKRAELTSIAEQIANSLPDRILQGRPPAVMVESLTNMLSQGKDPYKVLRVEQPGAKASSPATDIDDFVADAEAEAIRLGTSLTPGDRNKARLQFKRAQREEVAVNRLAMREADALTAETIRFNEEKGKQLAIIATAADVIKAKGEITPQAKIDIAKRRMGGNLATLAKHYIDLDSTGAMINVDKSTVTNIVSAARSSSVGQFLGRITGTNEQSLRSSISKLKPLLMNDIRKSTDMGARGMDSTKELEFYLQSATDETTDIQSNIAAIVVLDEAYGNGEVAAQLRELTNESLIKRISDQGAIILQGAAKKRKDPKQEAEDFLKGK